jgi:toxin ParE1/3/4
MTSGRSLLIRRTVRANADILDIWLYVAESNLVAADRILDDIERVCSLLITHPEMGRERPEIQKGIRSFAVAPWIILYRVHNDTIEVVRSCMAPVISTISISEATSAPRARCGPPTRR